MRHSRKNVTRYKENEKHDLRPVYMSRDSPANRADVIHENLYFQQQYVFLA